MFLLGNFEVTFMLGKKNRSFLGNCAVMEISLIKVLFAAVFFSQAQAFCGDRKLYGDLSRATVKAGEWLREQMDEQGTFKLGHLSAWAFHSLRLVGYSVPKVSKLGAEHLKQEINKTGLSEIPGGALALYILGVMSACKDPKTYYEQDLVAALRDRMWSYGSVGGFNHPFQLALAVVALCTSGERVNNSHVEHLMRKLKPMSDGSVHSIDTLSLGTVALSCIKRQQKKTKETCKENMHTKLRRAIKRAARQLRCIQREKKGKFGNEHTTSLAVQALLAAGVRWKKWDCKATMRNLLSMQKEDGAFMNVLGTIHAIPALIAALPYDVKDLSCPKAKEGNGGEQPNNITVCMRIEFEKNLTNKVPPEAEHFTVKNGTNAYRIMELASERHPCYKFTVVQKTWGRSITSICGVAKNHQKKLYWTIKIDPGRRRAKYGIDTLKPRDGECLVFFYRKFVWKK